MAEGGSVLKFPGGNPGKKDIPLTKAKAAPSLPVLDKFDYEQTVDLYQVATSVKRKGEELVSFVDKNRIIARQAGIEMLAVQITAILESDRFERVIDSLEDAVYRRVPISLTRDGADKVHRLESLIADADSSIVQFMTNRKTDPSLGQASYPAGPFPVYAERGSNDMSTWIPVMIIGIAGIVGVIAIIAITQPSRKP